MRCDVIVTLYISFIASIPFSRKIFDRELVDGDDQPNQSRSPSSLTSVWRAASKATMLLQLVIIIGGGRNFEAEWLYKYALDELQPENIVDHG
jgi:hypothetical protein